MKMLEGISQLPWRLQAMKQITEILSIVAHVIVNSLLAGAAVGTFAGSAYEVFRWISQ